MSTTAVSLPTPVEAPNPATLAMRFEVTVIPVTDVDRAIAFYHEQLGWRLDIDFEPVRGVRGVQITPPSSPASIQFGSGPAPDTPPTPLQASILAVDDIDAAREDLLSRGVEVSEVFHLDYDKGPVPGHDPDHRSYFSRAAFHDPDGNEWHLQEITQRIPGR